MSELISTDDVPAELYPLIDRLAEVDGVHRHSVILATSHCKLLVEVLNKLKLDAGKLRYKPAPPPPSFDALIDEIKMLREQFEKLKARHDDLEAEAEELRCGC